MNRLVGDWLPRCSDGIKGWPPRPRDTLIVEMPCCFTMTESLKDETAIVYVPEFREYGISLSDGGSSLTDIRFCPWCGAHLPAGLRDEHGEELVSDAVSKCGQKPHRSDPRNHCKGSPHRGAVPNLRQTEGVCAGSPVFKIVWTLFYRGHRVVCRNWHIDTEQFWNRPELAMPAST
jgi:hypothetical protein